MRQICAVLIVALFPACQGACRPVSPDGRDFPQIAASVDRHGPSMADLLSFTYSGTDAGTVTLNAGKWRGHGREGDPNVPEVELVRDFRLSGDITGNGTDEAVVLLQSRHLPSGSHTYLAVVGWIGGYLVNIATTPISDQVVLRGGHIEPGRIILDGVRRESDRSADAPTGAVMLIYELDGSKLRLTSGDPLSAPGEISTPRATPYKQG